MTSTATLAQLTGRGSFTFKLGGQRFRGQAVPLSEYFAWAALQGSPGDDANAAWYAQQLAERHQAGRNAPTIDMDWVLEHVRTQHIEALNNALLEEIDPGETLEADQRPLVIGGATFIAASYTLREFQAYQALEQAHADPKRLDLNTIPIEVRLEEVARALRLRHRKGLQDPAILTGDWVTAHLSKPALLGLENLFITGRLASDEAPQREASDPKP